MNLVVTVFEFPRRGHALMRILVLNLEDEIGCLGETQGEVQSGRGLDFWSQEPCENLQSRC